MLKLKVLGKVIESGLVAIVRTNSSDQAARIAEACARGGAAAIEITFTVPGATAVIEALAKQYASGEILIGAGTVLDPETARIAILAGAQYIVSPSVSPETARLCNRYQIPYMPGASTMREIVDAMECGADIVKLFPGETLGPAFVKAVKGPLPQASLMPTGGVAVDNVAEWIQAGAVAVGVGGSLTAGAQSGNFQQITDTAKQFIERIQQARKK
jgi:2-dehydro-3-deoxyphosphogluconate aldolase / (4S)-4-hydroxy-2-oxoglutarate aldolase